VCQLQRWAHVSGKQTAAQSSNPIPKEMGDSVDQKQYVIRTQSDRSYTYGLGEVVAPGVALFSSSPMHYGLSKEELNAELKKLGKVTIR